MVAYIWCTRLNRCKSLWWPFGSEGERRTLWYACRNAISSNPNLANTVDFANTVHTNLTLWSNFHVRTAELNPILWHRRKRKRIHRSYLRLFGQPKHVNLYEEHTNIISVSKYTRTWNMQTLDSSSIKITKPTLDCTVLANMYVMTEIYRYVCRVCTREYGYKCSHSKKQEDQRHRHAPIRQPIVAYPHTCVSSVDDTYLQTIRKYVWARLFENG